MNTPRTLGAALLVIASISVTLLWASPEKAAPAPRPEPAEIRTRTAPIRRTTGDAAPQGADRVPVQSTGREAPVVDLAEEDEQATQRYHQRIDDNIDHLEAAATEARAGGNLKRAELMEKRIEGLQRRMRELEG